MLGFKTYETATSILNGIEAMHMMKKGQLHQRIKSVQNVVEFIHKLFEIASLSKKKASKSTSMFPNNHFRTRTP